MVFVLRAVFSCTLMLLPIIEFNVRPTTPNVHVSFDVSQFGSWSHIWYDCGDRMFVLRAVFSCTHMLLPIIEFNVRPTTPNVHLSFDVSQFGSWSHIWYDCGNRMFVLRAVFSCTLMLLSIIEFNVRPTTPNVHVSFDVSQSGSWSHICYDCGDRMFVLRAVFSRTLMLLPIIEFNVRPTTPNVHLSFDVSQFGSWSHIWYDCGDRMFVLRAVFSCTLMLLPIIEFNVRPTTPNVHLSFDVSQFGSWSHIWYDCGDRMFVLRAVFSSTLMLLPLIEFNVRPTTPNVHLSFDVSQFGSWSHIWYDCGDRMFVLRAVFSRTLMLLPIIEFNVRPTTPNFHVSFDVSQFGSWSHTGYNCGDLMGTYCFSDSSLANSFMRDFVRFT
ncbi:hypothetical protein J6590_005320 [Homalodisca vitripennis]|nr:hypothetical protein J6590_005320 [Homalodisca vitripennis]